MQQYDRLKKVISLPRDFCFNAIHCDRNVSWPVNKNVSTDAEIRAMTGRDRVGHS